VTLKPAFSKAKYLLRSIANFNQKKICPFCGTETYKVVDRKYFFTSLLRCNDCGLQYRFPKDTKEFLVQFYQTEYSVDVHMMTDLPGENELKGLMEDNFSGLRNYSKYIKAINSNQNIRVLDYGCSWGYSIFQLKNAGYDVQGFEISVPRALYGKKLNVEIVTDHNGIRDNNDVILSSHVIEHLSDINDFIDIARKKLTREGALMIFCPNGSPEYRTREPELFHVNWGFIHPNYLHPNFVVNAFKDNPYLILTGDWDFDERNILDWNRRSQIVLGKRDGKELLFIVYPNIKI
jgi:transcription elongation factor Elf1